MHSVFKTLGAFTSPSLALGHSLTSLSTEQTGALPLTSSLSASNAIHNASAQAPFRAPTIFISVLYFSALAYYTYDLGLWVATGPSALLAVWGLWAVSSSLDT